MNDASVALVVAPAIAARAVVEILKPEVSDFESMAGMCADAFQEKRGRGCCILQSRAESVKEMVGIYSDYAKNHPEKIKHCGVVRGGGEDGQGIIGTCQLMLMGDCGDARMPEFTRHKLRGGEAYIEWIGVGDGARGKGVGGALMKWAEEFSRANEVTVLSLEVMTANPAISLYERKGFVMLPSKEDCCDACIGGMFIFW
jgi:ribosomal protein S18 acetylase RimI-like enzyme